MTSILLALLSACVVAPVSDDKVTDDSGETPLDDTGEPETVTLDGTCSDATRWGQFIVDSNEDYAYVSGAASDGVVPATVLTEVLSSGECTIWRRENPFCDPGCDPGYTCGLDGVCVPYPETQDLGTVTIDGLLNPVAMEPVTPGYTYFDTSLPNPPWAPGELLTMHTGGASPLTLHGVAPVTLAPTSMAWVIVEGEPLALSWDAPTEAVRTELVLSLRIDQHGTTPSSIECVFADDGAAEVPADVLEALMGAGVTGFPAGSLARRTADSTAFGAGCVELQATSSRLATVSISGYTPCTWDGECPDGTTCNEELERCE